MGAVVGEDEINSARDWLSMHFTMHTSHRVLEPVDEEKLAIRATPGQGGGERREKVGVEMLSGKEERRQVFSETHAH